MPTSELRDYLRARRAQVRPEEVGVATYGSRRVPGLRREEVAMLSGMSVDYYIRLEQGRERHPSSQILDALAHVLLLEDDARLHMYEVAGLTPSASRGTAPEQIDPQLLRLMDAWPENPAIVLGRAYDVLAGNQLAYALFEGFRHGPNLMMKIFLDPDAHRFYPDWETVAANTAAGFRMLQGRTPQDARIREVLDTLQRESPDFARIWDRHDARRKRLDRKRFHHSEVGEMTLRMHAFDVKSAPGQELIVYHAEPASKSAEALALLGSLSVTPTIA